MKRSIFIISCVVVLTALSWGFPPFHVRSVKAVHAAVEGANFNATNFVDKFWAERLLPALDKAADIKNVLTAIAAGPQKVREQYGRTVGISGSYFLFLRGSGRVVSVDADCVGLSLRAEGNEVDISVPLGLVFGNAIRDGTGLLDSSSFPNAQEFNDISARLNHIVESRVLPEMQRNAVVGKRMQFAGCVEVADEEVDLKPLKLVPVSVKFE